METTKEPTPPEAMTHRAAGDARRHALVRAAFEIIAERGFEGLRTREVAARAGVNIATLHYYFMSKEALIDGVADYLAEQFATLHAPLEYTGDPTPLDLLRQEFADAQFYAAHYPSMYEVTHEMAVRADRDPTIRNVLERLERSWNRSVEDILRDGVADGTFRADLDVVAATTILTCFQRGARYLVTSDLDFDRACAELEHWLLAQ